MVRGSTQAVTPTTITVIIVGILVIRVAMVRTTTVAFRVAHDFRLDSSGFPKAGDH